MSTTPMATAAPPLRTGVYDGAMVDLAGENVLDLIISFGFYPENGSWKPLT